MNKTEGLIIEELETKGGKSNLLTIESCLKILPKDKFNLAVLSLQKSGIIKFGNLIAAPDFFLIKNSAQKESFIEETNWIREIILVKKERSG